MSDLTTLYKSAMSRYLKDQLFLSLCLYHVELDIGAYRAGKVLLYAACTQKMVKRFCFSNFKMMLSYIEAHFGGTDI